MIIQNVILRATALALPVIVAAKSTSVDCLGDDKCAPRPSMAVFVSTTNITSIIISLFCVVATMAAIKGEVCSICAATD